MSPLVFFLLIICLKNVKVEEINLPTEEAKQLTANAELKDLIESGYYEYIVDEVEHEVNYMNIRIFTNKELRIAVKDKRRFWLNGRVPYVISNKYDSKQKAVILEAMDAFKNRTCVRFQLRKNESAFIFIQPGLGCSSTIGKANKNFVKLGNGCYKKGIVIHELLHVLGFLHEQSRTDRDEFVKINYDNIKEKQRKNFDKYPEHLIQTGNISYDYESIMHYGPFAFAKNKSIPTIVPLQKGVTIGQRRDFSKKDILKINIFYDCKIHQAKRRVKRHDDGAPSAFGVQPVPHRRIVPAAFPSNARKVEFGSGFSPVDYSLPKYAPVRIPRPDPRIVFPPEVYHDPMYSSADRRISPISYSKPVPEYEWPSYSPVEIPKPIYRLVEQPKVSYHPESHRVPGDYYVPPPRTYHRSEFSRPSYTTPGYHRLPYPPIGYPRPSNVRPSYTTAGYRRPSYASNYPKIAYPPVYSSPSYYKDRYPPVMKPYTEPYYDTTLVTLSPLNRTEITTTTEVITTATTTAVKIEDTTPIVTETTPTTVALTSTVAQTTTSAPTSTVAATTTSAPTSTAIATTTSAPTTTVPVTTTAVPTSTILQTTTAVPTSTILQTTTAVPTSTIPQTTTAVPTSTISVTSTVETTASPTSTQEQTSTVEITTATSFVTLSPLSTEKEYYRPYRYDFTSRNSEPFGTDGETHSIGYHKIHVFPAIESRTALKDPTALWTRGVVPYEFSDKYDNQQIGFLLEAMKEFHDKTCVRFVPRRNQASYIFVEPEQRCSAQIGKVPGSVNKVRISEGCYLQGTILHELMHTLGFVHEQNRPDRDQYVIVMWDNIIPEAKKNFRKYTWDEVQDFGQGYDYGSIMHYGSTEFSMDENRPTLVPLQAGVNVGQRDGFSPKDLAKINRLYKCGAEQDKEVVTSAPIEEFKKYFQSNVQRLFRSLLRAIQNFKPSKPKNS